METSSDLSRIRHRLGLAALAFSAVVLFVAVYFFAYRHLEIFNSEHDIHMVMARYFSWESRDFYYWGGNRIGSLLPLLLILPIKILNFDPYISVFVVTSLFYFGYIALVAVRLRSVVAASLLCLGFVLLPFGFYGLLLYGGHPYGQFLFLSVAGFSLLFPGGQPGTPPAWRAFLSGVVLSTGIWVSDTTLAALPGIGWLIFTSRQRWNIRSCSAFSIGLLTFLPFIVYWRYQIGLAGHNADYLSFASVDQVRLGLSRFVPQVSLLLNAMWAPGQSFAPLIATLTLIGLNLVALFLTVRKRMMPITQFLVIFNVSYVAMVLLARHSYFGEGGISRFWTPLVMNTICLAVLLSFELGQRGRRSVIFWISAATAVVFFATLARLRMVRRLPDAGVIARQIDVQRLEKLGAKYVFGTYWSAYPVTVESRFKILAVPWDFQFAEQFRKEVENASEVFIITRDVDMTPAAWPSYTLSPTSEPDIVLARKK